MLERMGKFRISHQVIADQPDLVRQMLKDCIIVLAKSMFMNDGIEYCAEHPSFDRIATGGAMPTYIAILKDQIEPSGWRSCKFVGWQKA